MKYGCSSLSTGNKKGEIAAMLVFTAVAAGMFASFLIFDGFKAKIFLSLSLISTSFSVLLAGIYPVVYIYALEGDDLTVTLVKGKKRRCVCRIGITDIKEISEKLKRPKKVKSYDYRGALFVKPTCRILFDDGIQKGVLLFTCSEEFASVLSSLVKLCSGENVLN